MRYRLPTPIVMSSPRPEASELPRVGTSTANRTLTIGDRTVHIIGTAHVSKQSVEEVQKVITEIRPDTVCVELDPMRYEALTDDSRWRKLNIFDVIKQKKVLFLMASLALQAFQRRLGDQLGVKPGSELLAAVEAAEQIGAEVVLADRDVQATLKRTWRNLGFLNKMKVLTGLVVSVFDTEEISEQQVEDLKNREHISDMMTEFAKAMPEVKGPLIDERDQYLMSSIVEAPGKTIVAVVGAGHVEGMTKWVDEPVDREALEQIPPPSLAGRAAKWVIPAIILAAFSYGYFKHQGEDFMNMLFAWILPNAIAAGALTLIAGGKILSVLTAVVSSPITSLNPTIGAGIPVGLVEAWLRKPTVEDCERLGKEVNTWRGLRDNPFSRILIVAIAAT
ncbi:MAG TPA: TraB/GumN family protein, partial [Polyangiaceae bacterium]|nr:TraB/GumN family protein [Polyangiaceae bacterium]